jgi:hypothetical protein
MSRWPFRKRKSLGKLIDRTKQVLEDGTGQNHMQKLAALQVLEKQRQVMRVWLSFLLLNDLDLHSAHASSILCLDHSCACFVMCYSSVADNLCIESPLPSTIDFLIQLFRLHKLLPKKLRAA